MTKKEPNKSHPDPLSEEQKAEIQASLERYRRKRQGQPTALTDEQAREVKRVVTRDV